MPGIFKDSTAPYLLALLVTLVGWMFNSAIDSAKNLRVIEYRTERGKDGAIDTLTFRIRNQSMTQAINVGQFNFLCPLESTGGIAGISSCLVEMPSIGTSAQFLGGANFGIVNPIDPEPGSATTDARIPPGTEVAYRFGVKDKDTRLRFRYLISSDDIAGEKSSLQVKIIDEGNPSSAGVFGKVENLTLFIVSNYLSVLVVVILFLLALIALWIVVVLLVAIFAKKSTGQKEAERYQVEITHKEESHVATVNSN